MDASIAFILAYKVVSDDGVERTRQGGNAKTGNMNTDCMMNLVLSSEGAS